MGGLIMDNSQSLEFNHIKKMTVDNLLTRCRQYVGQYLSKSALCRFDKAYKEARFDEVKYILIKTYKRIKTKMKVSEYQKIEKAIIAEFPDAERIFVSSESNEGSRNEKMALGSEMTAIIVIGVAILVVSIIGALVYFKINPKTNNKTVGEVLSIRNKKDSQPEYTEKDKDLMALIHELSVIYDNTDKYLKS